MGLQRDVELSSFVLDMTKAMLRTGYYSSQHPEGKRALIGLHDDLAALMTSRGGAEVTFQLAYARDQRDGEDVVLYDGSGEMRMMGDVLTDGAANTFVPKFVEYFHRQGLLSFTLQKELTKADFEIFLERMTRPASSDVDNAGERLSSDLAEAGVRGVSVVFDEDRIFALSGSVPWRAELALTRLRKDLRMIPMLANASNEEIRRIKTRLMQDILRGIQEPPLIVALARHMPEALAGQEGVMAWDEAEAHLIEGVSTAILPATAEALAQPWLRPDDEFESDVEYRYRARLLKGIATRLLEVPDRAAAHALVVLFDNRLVQLDALPEHARDLVRANTLAEAALESPLKLLEQMDHSAAPEPYRLIIRDLKLAGDALINMGEWETAADITKELWQYAHGEMVDAGQAGEAVTALEWVGRAENVEQIAGGVIAAGRPQPCFVQLLGAIEPDAALSTLVLVLGRSQVRALRQWASTELGNRSWEAPQVLWRTLEDESTPWFVLRNVLAVVRDVGSESDYPGLTRLFEHDKVQVRAEALLTMMALAPQRASRLVERALGDAEPDVRRAAALALGTCQDPPADAVSGLIKLLMTDRESDGIRLQAAASLGHIAALGLDAPHREEILNVLRTLVEDKYGSKLQRFRRFAKSRHVLPSHLLAAVVAGLGAVGDPYDEPLLEQCLEDDSPEVRDAARHAVGRLRASSMPPPKRD